MTDAEPRTWEMYTHRFWDEDSGRTWYHHFGDERYVRLYSATLPMVRVRLVEDSEGGYMGWLTLKDRFGNEKVGEAPVMVTRRKIFDVQFPYGHEADEAKGLGRAVALRVEEID